MVALGLKSILTRIDLGKMILDPRPSFQAVWLNQKCWYLRNGGAGWVKPEILIQNLLRAFLARIKLIRANLPQFHSFSFLPGISDRAVSISPCFGDGNLDPQTPRMWIPNMFCRFPIIPLYLTFLFFWEIETKRLWNHLVLKVEILIDQD